MFAVTEQADRWATFDRQPQLELRLAIETVERNAEFLDRCDRFKLVIERNGDHVKGLIRVHGDETQRKAFADAVAAFPCTLPKPRVAAYFLAHSGAYGTRPMHSIQKDYREPSHDR